MGLKTAGVGHFTIPTSPAVGTTVAQSGSANTYGSYVAMTASTSAALYITGVYVELAAGANIPTYVAVQLGTGGAGSETTVGIHHVPLGPTSGVANTTWAVYKPIFPYIPVANATRIAAKTASSVASALSWAVTLECINQSNVVDDGVAESTNVTQWNGTNVASPATAGIPDVNVKNINNAAAATPGASGGILISGSNSGTTTLAALTITGATTHTGNVVFSDGITVSAPSTGNRAGLDITGNGTGAAVKLAAGATGKGIAITTTAGDGLSILPTGGHGIVATGNGTSKHGAILTGGTAGTSDGMSLVAGTGGVDLRANQTGNITGNLSGSAGSVTGAVGSVTGNVGGNVTGSVGSVTGNVGGNVVGSVASVTARVTANTDQLAGQTVTAAAGVTFPTSVASPTNITAGTITTATNVTTVNGLAAGVITATSIAADAITDAKVASDVTIASVTGSVGSVTGAVGSVTGNVGGNVTGSVGSVVGAVGSVTGNVGGNVTGSVGSVVGLTASNLDVAVSSRLPTSGYTAPANSDIAAIKSKTDNLGFTVAGQVDANVESINATTVTGSGTSGDPWGA